MSVTTVVVVAAAAAAERPRENRPSAC